MLTHLPYRSWCVDDVRGEGRSMGHRRSEGERGVRDVHLDSCFLGGADDEKTKTVIVVRDRDSKMVTASVVPVKVSSHQFPELRVRAFLSELGCENLDVALRNRTRSRRSRTW